MTQALRLDDVGAASKQHEVYGVTRIRLGGLALPFPGNFLFLKYVPPVKRWGPYRELTAGEWERILAELERHGARMTVGITAGWVERDGRIVPFPRKFPDAAAMVRRGAERGLLEIANHGYTHCVLDGGRYRPRLFSGNRREHREFHEWLPEAMHREHVSRAQGILQDFLGAPVLTFVPPGNVFARVTLEAAAAAGLRYVSCLAPERRGDVEGMTVVGDEAVHALHDRDLVLGGMGFLTRLLADRRDRPFVTVREVGARLESASR
ncbi:MAG TPA: polysaccharide deacetylase family protein [Candidatus Bathyarchaeia archaeon]|nr:polysaccharide deacetylase family protein [Candidatus Bathyarchaeia archaeon]